MGHEFHYASTLAADDDSLVECRDAAGASMAEGGARRGSVTGTFFHAIDFHAIDFHAIDRGQT
jgi:cobyrinic acid a,c-diamide synthase